MVDKESAEPTVVESESAPPVMRRSERYVNIYTNQIEVGFSPWDIQLSLMQVHGRTGDVLGEELATATMSPQHAKALIFPFLKTIMQYEEQHGTITMPTNKMAVPLFDLLRNMIQQTIEKAEAMKQAAEANNQETAEK